MQRKYWNIKMKDGKEFNLTPEEYEILKRASLQGLNLVFFKKKSISIPAIAYMEEKSEEISNLPQLPELGPEEHERAKAKLDEIRNTLKKKMRMN